MERFTQEKRHIAVIQDVVTEDKGDPFMRNFGVLSLEDVIEEILMKEIEDEH